MHPATLAENKQSVIDIDHELEGAAVTLDGEAIDIRDSATALALLRDAEPAVFGVRATTARISEPGRTSGHPIRVFFDEQSLELRYVPAGNVAPYGLLFDPYATNAWEIVSLPGPDGYAQQVCSVPPAFEALLDRLGVEGHEQEGILETRLVPLDEAQREVKLDRIEARKAGRTVVLPAGDPNALVSRRETEIPPEPYVGEGLTLLFWYAGADPFPEAVEPLVFDYALAVTRKPARGVLTLVEQGTIANGALGRAGQPAVYASPELDRLLREAGLVQDGS
jgi:hypothetical protein